MYQKHISIAAVLVTVLTLLLPGLVTAGTTYGMGVGNDDTVAISAIYDDPANYVGKSVKVEGLIVDVCSRRGCWMSLASDRAFETLRVKVTDGEIVFPITARGKRAVVQGKVQEIKMTMEQAIEFKRHQAQESGKPFDPASVTGPVTLYQVYATGAIVE